MGDKKNGEYRIGLTRGVMFLSLLLLWIGAIGFAGYSDRRALLRLEAAQTAIYGEIEQLQSQATAHVALLQGNQEKMADDLLSYSLGQKDLDQGHQALVRELRQIEVELAELALGFDRFNPSGRNDSPSLETRVQALLDAGELSFREGDYSTAINRMEAALALDPASSRAQLYHAAALFRENQADTLRFTCIKEELSQVLGADPSNSLALEILGEVAFEEEAWPRAMLIYSRLGTHDPGLPDYRMRLIYAAEAAGSLKSVLQEIESLLTSGSESGDYEGALYSRRELQSLRDQARSEFFNREGDDGR